MLPSGLNTCWEEQEDGGLQMMASFKGQTAATDESFEIVSESITDFSPLLLSAVPRLWLFNKSQAEEISVSFFLCVK